MCDHPERQSWSRYSHRPKAWTARTVHAASNGQCGDAALEPRARWPGSLTANLASTGGPLAFLELPYQDSCFAVPACANSLRVVALLRQPKAPGALSE